MLPFFAADRLVNFDVGVTVTAPNVVVPTLGNYALCYSYGTNYPTYVANINCAATSIGRYLIIQFRLWAMCLTLCDVKVFGSPVPCKKCFISTLVYEFYVTGITAIHILTMERRTIVDNTWQI